MYLLESCTRALAEEIMMSWSRLHMPRAKQRSLPCTVLARASQTWPSLMNSWRFLLCLPKAFCGNRWCWHTPCPWSCGQGENSAPASHPQEGTAVPIGQTKWGRHREVTCLSGVTGIKDIKTSSLGPLPLEIRGLCGLWHHTPWSQGLRPPVCKMQLLRCVNLKYFQVCPVIPHASREGLNSEARVSQEASFSLLHTHIHIHTESETPTGPSGARQW